MTSAPPRQHAGHERTPPAEICNHVRAATPDADDVTTPHWTAPQSGGQACAGRREWRQQGMTGLVRLAWRACGQLPGHGAWPILVAWLCWSGNSRWPPCPRTLMRRAAGRLVLVAGEAGAGKSALITQFTAGLSDTRCYLGTCDGLFTPRPLGAFLDIAGQLGGELADRFRGDAGRDELFGLLLGQLAQPGGLRVVVVEDIQWADEATLDLLRYLSRRIISLPVLLVVTYREDEVADSKLLRVALGDLAVQRCTRRVELVPLSAAAVAVLAAGSGLDAAELHQLTGGNPFYVVESLRAGLDKVPRSAMDAVLARAAGLGPGARDVLHVAALTGAVVELWLLERAARATPELADELVARGLLVADGTTLRFRHEIARRAVLAAIPGYRQPAVSASGRSPSGRAPPPARTSSASPGASTRSWPCSPRA